MDLNSNTKHIPTSVCPTAETLENNSIGTGGSTSLEQSVNACLHPSPSTTLITGSFNGTQCHSAPNHSLAHIHTASCVHSHPCTYVYIPVCLFSSLLALRGNSSNCNSNFSGDNSGNIYASSSLATVCVEHLIKNVGIDRHNHSANGGNMLPNGRVNAPSSDTLGLYPCIGHHCQGQGSGFSPIIRNCCCTCGHTNSKNKLNSNSDANDNANANDNSNANANFDANNNNNQDALNSNITQNYNLIVACEHCHHHVKSQLPSPGSTSCSSSSSSSLFSTAHTSSHFHENSCVSRLLLFSDDIGQQNSPISLNTEYVSSNDANFTHSNDRKDSDGIETPSRTHSAIQQNGHADVYYNDPFSQADTFFPTAIANSANVDFETKIAEEQLLPKIKIKFPSRISSQLYASSLDFSVNPDAKVEEEVNNEITNEQNLNYSHAQYVPTKSISIFSCANNRAFKSDKATSTSISTSTAKARARTRARARRARALIAISASENPQIYHPNPFSSSISSANTASSLSSVSMPIATASILKLTQIGKAKRKPRQSRPRSNVSGAASSKARCSIEPKSRRVRPAASKSRRVAKPRKTAALHAEQDKPVAAYEENLVSPQNNNNNVVLSNSGTTTVRRSRTRAAPKQRARKLRTPLTPSKTFKRRSKATTNANLKENQDNLDQSNDLINPMQSLSIPAPSASRKNKRVIDKKHDVSRLKSLTSSLNTTITQQKKYQKPLSPYKTISLASRNYPRTRAAAAAAAAEAEADACEEAQSQIQAYAESQAQAQARARAQAYAEAEAEAETGAVEIEAVTVAGSSYYGENSAARKSEHKSKTASPITDPGLATEIAAQLMAGMAAEMEADVAAEKQRRVAGDGSSSGFYWRLPLAWRQNPDEISEMATNWSNTLSSVSSLSATPPPPPPPPQPSSPPQKQNSTSISTSKSTSTSRSTSVSASRILRKQLKQADTNSNDQKNNRNCGLMEIDFIEKVSEESSLKMKIPRNLLEAAAKAAKSASVIINSNKNNNKNNNTNTDINISQGNLCTQKINDNNILNVNFQGSANMKELELANDVSDINGSMKMDPPTIQDAESKLQFAINENESLVPDDLDLAITLVKLQRVKTGI